MRHKVDVAALLATITILLSLSSSCIAADPAAPPEPNAADSFKPGFVLHGYLTGAYGMTTGGQFLGVPKDGTADYLRTALQLRFEITPKDTTQIQLRHIQIGNSPQAQFKQDVELNWAFYEHRFNDHLRIRIGRAPLPYALDNELHSVGVVLPFYRLPISVYPPDTFNLETLDGAHLSDDHHLFGDWSSTVDAFAGAITKGNEYFPVGGQVVANSIRNPDLRGARVLVHNSDDTVQFYVSDFRAAREFSALNGFQRSQLEVLSEGGRLRYRRLEVEAEHSRWSSLSRGGSWVGHPGYVQLGYAITDRLSVHGLAERLPFDVQGPHEKGDYIDSLGASVVYRLSRFAVAKIEHHRVRTYFEDAPVRNVLADPQFHTSLILTSISFAF